MDINTVKALLNIKQVPDYFSKACETVPPPIVDESGKPLDAAAILKMGHRRVEILGSKDLAALKQADTLVLPIDERLNKYYSKLTPQELEENLKKKMKWLLELMLPVAIGSVQHKRGEQPVIESVMVCERLPIDPSDKESLPTGILRYSHSNKQILVSAERLIGMAARLDFPNTWSISPIYPGMKVEWAQLDFLLLVEEAFHGIPLKGAEGTQHLLELQRGVHHDNLTLERKAHKFCREVAQDFGFINPPRRGYVTVSP